MMIGSLTKILEVYKMAINKNGTIRAEHIPFNDRVFDSGHLSGIQRGDEIINIKRRELYKTLKVGESKNFEVHWNTGTTFEKVTRLR